MPTAIPVLALAGTPYARGLAHGKAMQERIVSFAASVTAVHQANNTYLTAERSALLAFCMRNLGFLEKFSPELMEEMRGIADGAGVPFEEIVYLNSFLELEDLRAPGLGAKILPDSLWGCTTFNVTTKAGADGRALIGQTFDMERYYEQYLCILRIKSETGPEVLALSFAGVLGLCGINAAGVGVVINKIAATDARPGVIYPFVLRKALGAERIGDALGAVIFSPRATGINYQLAGGGIAFCAETSATSYELLSIDGAIAHTNHYVGQTMRRFETPNWLSHGGSMVRKLVADEFLATRRGELSPEALKALSRDHTNHPRCICAHGFPGEGADTAFHTVFGVVMDPAAGWFEACPGNPCENEYRRYAL
ncbi:MAG: C45 family autoproteolytic acyltransferase/hydrolase [Solidesulfovibrio sp.]